MLSCSIFDDNTNQTLQTSSDYETLRSWLLGDKGYLTAKWGEEDCNYWGSLGGLCSKCGDCNHTGVDYGTSGKYENVYAVASGYIVLVVGERNLLCIYNEPTKVTFCYLHLSSFEVTSGGVQQGELIGKTGMRGANSIHLHFEARPGEKAYAACCYNDTINPIEAAELARTIIYVNQNNPDEYLKLKADGTFYLMEMGIGFTGEWEVEGDVLKLYYSKLGITLEGRVEGNKIIDPDGKVWIRQTPFP